MKTRICAALAAVVLLAGCSFENKYERKADDMTKAVINNNITPVMSEISPGARITRVQIAEWSDELVDQGKLQSVKQQTDGCADGTYCFVVTFEKGKYAEQMKLDDHDQIVGWRFHKLATTGS